MAQDIAKGTAKYQDPVAQGPPTVDHPVPFIQGEPSISASSPPAGNEVAIKEGDASKLLPDNLGIADAFKAAIAQILMVNHTTRPCLTPTAVKVEMDFQISRKNDSKLSVGPGIGNFKIISVGTGHIKQNDYTNSIIAPFKTEGSSAAR